MSLEPGIAPTGDGSGEWIEKMSQFLIDHDEVEAIQLKPEKGTVAVATLGKVDEAALNTHAGCASKSPQHRTGRNCICIPAW